MCSNRLSYQPIYGGEYRTRTDDFLLAKQALSQLSYSPVSKLVGPEGIEPSTSRLSSVRSNQLSYEPRISKLYSKSPKLYIYVRVADLKQLTSCEVPAKSYRPILSSKENRIKEVIQPHLPVRLPCYDFTPITNHNLGPRRPGYFCCN